MTSFSWAEARRKEELFAFVRKANQEGSMPTTTVIYKHVGMAKATAHKYLAVLKAEGKVDYKRLGSTFLWYVVKDDIGNKVEPKIQFQLCG